MISRILAFFLLVLLSPILVAISILIFFSSETPIFYRQKRVGVANKHFILYKFRTMINNTPDIATHLIDDPSKYYIKYGELFRKLSLDELPQLYNIIIGDMIFIGPRPALYNQNDLIKLRTEHNIHNQIPGITGWAQVNGRDQVSIEEKVRLERFYLEKKSFLLDAKIIFLTIVKVISNRDVTH